MNHFYLTLFTAFLLSGVAEYFSIMGLIAVFAAAPIPVAVMGVSLGIAKLVAASWAYRNWTTAPVTLKYYFTAAVIILSFITSMGIFGYLSKAHMDQGLVSGDILAKIAIYDEKIQIAKENIDSNRRQLKQMDEAVDQVMVRSTTEEGAAKANTIRKSQQRDRNALSKDIEANQKIISQLNDEAAPIRAMVRQVEAEIGPIKYIAALLYGDNPDVNLLERSVRWVIITIVLVFDPLAILLLIAANFTLKQMRGEVITAVETPDTPAVNLFQEPNIDSQVLDPPKEETKEGWAPEMFRRVRHEIPKEIMEKVFKK